MNPHKIKKAFRSALQKFVDREIESLQTAKPNEMTYSHRIAVHLENENAFKGYNIDCEYNKLLGDKKLNQYKIEIRPDIIVHKRNDNNNNLLIIEVKKSGRKSKLYGGDIIKLKRCSNLKYEAMAVVGILKERIETTFIYNDNKGELQEEEIDIFAQQSASMLN